jgi:hypothetical protein
VATAERGGIGYGGSPVHGRIRYPCGTMEAHNHRGICQISARRELRGHTTLVTFHIAELKCTGLHFHHGLSCEPQRLSPTIMPLISRNAFRAVESLRQDLRRSPNLLISLSARSIISSPSHGAFRPAELTLSSRSICTSLANPHVVLSEGGLPLPAAAYRIRSNEHQAKWHLLASPE